MKRAWLILCVLLAVVTAARAEDVLKSVDPFLGAEAGGNTVPGAAAPFGMAKISLDTKGPWTNGWSEGGEALGISQTHVSGTGGSGKYGNFRVMPWVGSLLESEFVSPREAERAEVGYYTVTYAKTKVKAEVTATRMVGLHRYTFPADAASGAILLDAGSLVVMTNRANTQRMAENSIRIIPPNRMEGMIDARGGWGMAGHVLYFSAEFDRPFAEYGIRAVDPRGGAMMFRQQATEGASDRANQIGFARFLLGDARQLQVKIAVSFVSAERARSHLEKEVPTWDFNTVRAASARQWAGMLGKVKVAGGSEEDRTKFYTALYRMYQMPVDLTGDNAWWESDAPHYEDFYCLWDTFRGLHPWLLLLEPERQRDMLNSLLDTYAHTGWLPDARIAGKNGFVQGGTNADVLFADAAVKGLTGVDYAKAFEAVKKNADIQSDDPLHYGRDVTDYHRLGYLPVDYAGDRKNQSYGRSASRTMEYCYNDFCVGLVAKKLGREEEAAKYFARAQGWKKLWDESTQAIRPRYADGKWFENYSRQKRFGGWADPFFQANGWTYSTYVPHDGQGLINLIGGDEKTVAWLDAFFASGSYDQGNEPGFLAAFLYIHAGRPDRTQERVREILTETFKTGVRGLPGNDDAGAESAWIVSASVGLYPNAGQDYYYLCSPIFERTELSIWGKAFTIEAPGASLEKKYITAATLNGKPLDRAWVTHAEVVAGGTLRLEMSEKPGAWGKAERPFSMTR